MFTRAQVLLCIHFEFKRIIIMSVKNIIFVGEIFQIEVSNGPVHQLGTCRNINLYAAMVSQGYEFCGVCIGFSRF